MVELKTAAIVMVAKRIPRPEGGVDGPQFRKAPITAPQGTIAAEAQPIAGITCFQKVMEILDQSIGGQTVSIGAHGAFWRSLTRDQFVARKVIGLALVVLGNGAGSTSQRR